VWAPQQQQPQPHNPYLLIPFSFVSIRNLPEPPSSPLRRGRGYSTVHGLTLPAAWRCLALPRDVDAPPHLSRSDAAEQHPSVPKPVIGEHAPQVRGEELCLCVASIEEELCPPRAVWLEAGRGQGRRLVLL
jgi:hypothetical protein